MRLSSLLASIALVLSVGAADAKTLQVVASFSVLADVVKHVGGTHVSVRSLVPPYGDPHDYEPTPDDARALKEADLAVVSGLGLETWFTRLAKGAGYAGTPIVASEGIATIRGEEDGRTVTDPHVWNDPANVETWIRNVERALVTSDPDDAADIHANAKAYGTAVAALTAYGHGKIDPIPVAKRKVLTSHDAFGYFAKAFDVTFLSPVGLSTESEASAATIARLIKQIKAEKVTTYFFENSNDPRLVKQIAAATGAQPGGVLFVESLSPPDGPAASYEDMFRYDVDQLADAMSR